MKTDIEIAQSVTPAPITEIAKKLEIDEQYLEPYGRTKAKIDYNFMKQKKDTPDGKLILVTAITPTPAGEGKTTTSVGLADAAALSRHRGYIEFYYIVLFKFHRNILTLTAIFGNMQEKFYFSEKVFIFILKRNIIKSGFPWGKLSAVG